LAKDEILLDINLDLFPIQTELRFEERTDLNWEKHTFSTELLKFSWSHDTDRSPGLVEYISPIDQQRLHWIWNDHQAAEVDDRDWGRYLILAAEEIDVMLYDDRRYLLAIPATVPLPRFLARAATLCSGLAPESGKIGEDAIGGLPAGHAVDIYTAVPPSIAQSISEKLSQNLLRYDINIENGKAII